MAEWIDQLILKQQEISNNICVLNDGRLGQILRVNVCDGFGSFVMVK